LELEELEIVAVELVEAVQYFQLLLLLEEVEVLLVLGVQEVEDTLLEMEQLVIRLQQIHLKEIMVVTDLIKLQFQVFLLVVEVVVLPQSELMLLQLQEEMEVQAHLIQF
jgi:hypothetical protein